MSAWFPSKKQQTDSIFLLPLFHKKIKEMKKPAKAQQWRVGRTVE
jgi:hypothetical protein